MEHKIIDIEKTIKSLEKNGYSVRFFESHKTAVKYLVDNIQNKRIGFGGSRTLTDLHLQKKLSKNNTVLNPDFPDKNENFRSTALKSMDADYYFLSANGLSEDGIIVNLDGNGNRLAGSLFGHKKVYYIIGTNKIEKNLEDTIWRVRNVAAPKNAVRFHVNTPCALKGDKCYDCDSPQRICKSLLIHLRKPDSADAEVILIDENLGF